jgi:SAM-dependent methyltransferase
MTTSLQPIAEVRKRVEYEGAMTSPVIREVNAYQRGFSAAYDGAPLKITGYCLLCQSHSDFLVDMLWGGVSDGGVNRPNWRERLVCSHCGLNNRQRLIGTMIDQFIHDNSGSALYFMEFVTPIFQWFLAHHPKEHIVGSEYLGDYSPGQIVNGIRHENIQNLSFPDESIDLVVSTDVFEHVMDPLIGFAESRRVLKPNGIMLATFPFSHARDQSVVRAMQKDGEIHHILPPDYHGNPLSEEGSLVFTDFGWSVLTEMQRAGFSDAKILLFGSIDHCHLSAPQLVFLCRK